MGCVHSDDVGLPQSHQLTENTNNKSRIEHSNILQVADKKLLIINQLAHIQNLDSDKVKQVQQKEQKEKAKSSLNSNAKAANELNESCKMHEINKETIVRMKDTQKYSNEFILSILSSLKRSHPTCGLLSNSIFDEIEESFKKNWYSPSHQRQLATQLLKYIKYCQDMTQNSENLDKDEQAIKQFGQSIFRVQNQSFFENKSFLRIFQYLAEKGDKNKCFLQLKFEMEIQQALSVAGKVRDLFQYDERVFLLLAFYLYKSCLNLQKLGRSLLSIEGTLLNTIKEIQKEYPAAPSLSNGQETSQLKNIKMSLDQMKFDIIDLKSIPINQRKQYLEEYIMQRAQQAQNSKRKFVELIDKICRQKGSHLKVGLKIRDKHHKRAIERVIEKIIKKQFTKFTVQQFSKQKPPELKTTLAQYLCDESVFHDLQMSQIYGNLNDPIKFEVSDLLRGKCLFQTVAQINECALNLMEKIRKEGFGLVELDNRLLKNTSDMVFKILVDKTVAELQLPIDFNLAHNQFDHKIYEVKRSQFHSPFAMLKIIIEEMSTDLLPQVIECFDHINNSLSHQEQLRIYQEKETFQSLKESFKTLLRQLSIFSEVPEAIGAKMNDTFDFVKLHQEFIVLNQSNQTNLAIDQFNNLYKNDGDYYVAAFQYQKSIEPYKKYLQVHSQKDKNVSSLRKISNINSRIGLTYLKISDFSQALSFYEAHLSTNPKENDSDRMDQAAALNSIGLIYNAMGNRNKALDNIHKCVEIQVKVKGQAAIEIVLPINNIGQIYSSQGKYSEALAYFTKALSVQKINNIKQDMNTAMIYNNIAANYDAQALYSEALNYYTLCLQIQEKIKGKKAVETSTTLNNIGYVYKKMKKYPEAKSYYAQCLEIEERVKGKQSIDTATSINNIAMIYLEQGNYQSAIQNLQRCLRIQIKVFGEESFHIAGAYAGLAQAYKASGKCKEELSFYQKCLKIYEQCHEQSQKAAFVLYKIGVIYLAKDDYNKALSFLNRGLNMLEQAKREDTTQMANILNQIGQVYLLQEKPNKALKHFLKCLEIQKNKFGERAIEIAGSLKNIATANNLLKKYDEAMMNLINCLKIEEKARGKGCFQTATTLNLISSLHFSEARYSLAIDYAVKCLTILQKFKGQDSASLCETLNNIGFIYFTQKKYDQSIKYYKRCLSIKEKAEGEQNIAIVVALKNIGQVYRAKGQYSEAIQYYLRCLNIHKNALGQENSEYAQYLNKIGLIYFSKGEWLESLTYFSQCLKIQEKVFGQAALEITPTLRNMGTVYKKMKKSNEAIEHYHRFINTKTNAGEKETSQIGEIMCNIGQIYEEDNNYQEALQYFSKCYEIDSKIMSKWTIETAETLGSIALVLFKLGKNDEGKDKFHEARKIYVRLQGEESQKVKIIDDYLDKKCRPVES